MNSVADLLQQAASAPAAASALDAVMGEDWAALRLGNPTQAMQLQAFVGQQARRTANRCPAVSASMAGGNPQALVKFIRKGGASDAAGLRAQMAYLGREGEVALRRSENYLGVEVTADDLEATWQLPEARPGGCDRTSHFLVSFPHGTSEPAAERAGRAWAEELFASGRFGDTWDYYTAFHTDRAHPHLHVVVNRRGEEHGLWLKLSRRSELNYDMMREVQVEAAAREGIYLGATPRLARGVHDLPVADKEIRDAAKADRAPVTPEHTPLTAARNAAAVLYFARRYAADAAMIEEIAPAFAKAMKDASDVLLRGEAVTGAQGEFTHQEVERVSEAIEELRERVEAKFARIDRELAGLPAGMDRTPFERQAALLKRDAAGFLPDRDDLQSYRREDREGRFSGGIVAQTPRIAEIRDAADAQVRGLAQAAGVDPAATVERYALAPPRKGWPRPGRGRRSPSGPHAGRVMAWGPKHPRRRATGRLRPFIAR